MRKLNLPSLGLGIVSGVIVLVLFGGVSHLLHGTTPAGNPAAAANFNGGGNGGPNLARFAQRLGITQDQLQQELNSGKTMQQIAAEHGITFGGFGRRGGSGSQLRTGSGTANTGSSASVTSVSASSQGH